MVTLDTIIKRFKPQDSELYINEIDFKLQDTDAITSLVETVKSAANLQIIVFYDVNFKQTDFFILKELFEAIQEIPKLTSLAFKGCSLADAEQEFLIALGQAIAKTSIYSLKLHFNLPFEPNQKQVQNVFSLLKASLDNKQLLHLDLSRNPFGVLCLQNFQEFCQLLSQSKVIKQINLSYANLDELEPGSLTCLSAAFAKINTDTIDLAVNGLGYNSDFFDFIQSLSAMRNLQKLCLKKNHLSLFFDSLSLGDLANSIQALIASGVQELDLSYNQLGQVVNKDQLITDLKDLSTNGKLLDLILANNDFNSEDEIKLRKPNVRVAKTILPVAAANTGTSAQSSFFLSAASSSSLSTSDDEVISVPKFE